METPFYIRVRGRVLGPYELEKLQGLARRGQLSRLHEVSADGATWVKASTYPEIFVTPPLAPSPASAGAASSTSLPPQAGHAPTSQESAVAGVNGGALRPSAPQALSARKWYYDNKGTPEGPLSASTLQQMLACGQIESECMVWSEGMPVWVPAKQVGDLSGALPSGGTHSNIRAVSEELPLSLCRAAAGSRPWALFLAVMAFIYAGLSFTMALLCLISGIYHHVPPLVATGIFSMVYGGMAMTGGWLLASYSSRLSGLGHSPSALVLEKALEVLRSFWIYISIVTIVFLAFLAFVVIWLLAIGMSMPTFG